MTRLLALSAPLVFLPAVLAAPAPDDKKEPVLYFPTKVGTKWVYESPASKSFLRITTVETKEGAKLVTVASESELAGQTFKTVETFRVSGEGLFKLGFDEKVFDPPQCLLKLPHVPGAKWEWLLKGDDKFRVDYKAGKLEDVKVPAGEFKAVPVEDVLTGNAVRMERTVWYAPNVGVVKKTWLVNGGGQQTEVLKSFTPGKD
ncbi:MAG TPA: hypothetical protein VKE74_12400 [Gemmataceae bacterium]|nr:hypothetical protein [Gemmataceae bacterium]